MTADGELRDLAVGALIAATAGDDPELGSPADIDDAEVAEHIVNIVLAAAHDDTTVTIPTAHIPTITAALEHHLDDYQNPAGIGEQTAAGAILRALDWARDQNRSQLMDEHDRRARRALTVWITGHTILAVLVVAGLVWAVKGTLL